MLMGIVSGCSVGVAAFFSLCLTSCFGVGISNVSLAFVMHFYCDSRDVIGGVMYFCSCQHGHVFKRKVV